MREEPRQIAMQSTRTFEEFRLATSEPARIREVGVVGTAYDSVLAAEITYVSTPITSGAALYAAMDAAGISDPDELRGDRERFAQEVVGPNLSAADAVARRMVAFGGAVIAPAAFEARSLGWSQDEYMGLWLDVIERKATRLAMVDGWQLSNGGAEEYLQALLMQAGRRDRNDMEVVDARGETMTHAHALELLASAVSDLVGRGFRPVQLARVLHRCVLLHGMVRDEYDYGQLTDTCGRTVFTLGEGYARSSRGKDMRQANQAIRTPLVQARGLLDRHELAATSSLEIAPGIVRSSGRGTLSERPATVLAPEEDKTRDGS